MSRCCSSPTARCAPICRPWPTAGRSIRRRRSRPRGCSLGLGRDRVELDGARAIVLGGRRVPLDGAGPPAPRPSRARGHAADLFPGRPAVGRLEPSLLRGKVVVLGASAVGAGDRFATPFVSGLPGSEHLGTAIDNLLTGQILRRARCAGRLPYRPAPGGTAALLAGRRSPWWSLGVLLLLLGGLATTLQLAFVMERSGSRRSRPLPRPSSPASGSKGCGWATNAVAGAASSARRRTCALLRPGRGRAPRASDRPPASTAPRTPSSCSSTSSASPG